MHGEDVDLDLEEATAAANTPLVPGVAANPRGGPSKRGRGARGPRNPVGQSKRERKVCSIKSLQLQFSYLKQYILCIKKLTPEV